MGILHGLAVVLIIFERIIIECKGASNVTASSSRTQNIPIIEVSRSLPIDLIEQLIIGRSEFETIKDWVAATEQNPSNNIYDIMGKLLKNRIVVIYPHKFEGITYEYQTQDGDIAIRFATYRSLLTFFKKFGDKVKKIDIHYHEEKHLDKQFDVNQNIIKPYAKYLDELRMKCKFTDRYVWNELLSDDGNDITFPNVKRFEFNGHQSIRKEFNLNVMFPNLESIKLVGIIGDNKCLANLANLNGLEVDTVSFEEDDYIPIFENNMNLEKLYLASPNHTQTMECIARTLTKLKTFGVCFARGSFLSRTEDQELYELSLVEHFNIISFAIDELVREPSFYMPLLKTFSLTIKRGDVAANEKRNIDFINHFFTRSEKLERFEFIIESRGTEEQFQDVVNIFPQPTWTHSKTQSRGKFLYEGFRKHLILERRP